MSDQELQIFAALIVAGIVGLAVMSLVALAMGVAAAVRRARRPSYHRMTPDERRAWRQAHRPPPPETRAARGARRTPPETGEFRHA